MFERRPSDSRIDLSGLRIRSGFSAGAALIPTIVFSATFTVGANVVLSLYTPEIGTGLSLLWTTTSEATTGYIVNASLDAITQNAANDSGSIYTLDATYATANYFVQADLTGHGIAAGHTWYLFVRVQDQENMYAVKLTDNDSGTTTCQLYKKVAGTFTALGSAFNPPAVGSVIKLEMIGSALKFYDDGVEIASATDTDISAAGKAGIGGSGGAELVTPLNDSTSNNRLDNLSVTVYT